MVEERELVSADGLNVSFFDRESLDIQPVLRLSGGGKIKGTVLLPKT